MKKFVLIICGFLFTSAPVKAQCCGPDLECTAMCIQYFLFSGVGISYGVQQYSAEGFNHYIDVYNQIRTSTLTKQMPKFGSGNVITGTLYLVDLPVEEFRFGLKGSYSVIWENNFSEAGSIGKREYNLMVNSIGVGFDTRMRFMEIIEIKLADIQLLYSNATLTNKLTSASLGNTEEKLKSDESYFGILLGVGAAFYPLGDYLAVEANAGYSLFEIRKIKFSNGALLQQDENTNIAMDNFINGGGIFLNAGIKFALGLENIFK